MTRVMRPWTAEEIERLRALAGERSLRSAATTLGRLPSVVWNKAKQLEIAFAKTDRPPRWTRAEVLVLWELCGKRTLRQIARKLGRTPGSVRLKAHRLGIRASAGETIGDVAEYLGVSTVAVTRWRDRLGQKWRLRHSPRGPEIEEVRAIARAIAEGPGHGVGNLKTSIVRLRRIGEGRA